MPEPISTTALLKLLGGSAGLGALGGALSPGQDQQVSSFEGMSRPRTTTQGAPISIDPGTQLARAFEEAERLQHAMFQRATQPATFGPASIVQSPQFLFGGDLPFPVGQTGVDPGFSPRPGLDISGFNDNGGGGNGGGGGDVPGVPQPAPRPAGDFTDFLAATDGTGQVPDDDTDATLRALRILGVREGLFG